MFRKSETQTQAELFCGITQNLHGLRLKKFQDETSWHNIFREQIVRAIDESPFEVLFSEDEGRPNSAIRILVGMMILKEGRKSSDEQLFEDCQFNLLVMSSLGLNNLSDSVATPATYYNLKKALYEHQVKTGEDLIGEQFNLLTKKHAELFGVHGEFIRMDSTLVGSNIAKSSRLQLIINVLQVFYKDIAGKRKIVKRLLSKDKEYLEVLCKQKSGQILYKIDVGERERMLEDLGYLLVRIEKNFSERDSEKYHLIRRVLMEQYRIEGEQTSLRPIKEISSESLQSPHDEDAVYRNKNGEQVRGYSANITETNNKDSLNLITDVQLEKATIADNKHFQPAIEGTKTIVGEVENVNTDGAYHSQSNDEYVKEESINLILSGIQGRICKYEFNKDVEDNLIVTNKEKGEEFKAKKTKRGRYKIEDNGQRRYFSQEDIDNYNKRGVVESIPKWKKELRNNIEASIFQLKYPLRNGKTKYRGLFKNRLWAFFRCLWINFVRIKNHIGKLCPDVPEFKNSGQVLTNFVSFIVSFLFVIRFNRKKSIFIYQLNVKPVC